MNAKFVVAILLSNAGIAVAQGLPPTAQLPTWAVQQLDSLANKQGVEVNARINPFVLRGDFDGDGKGDLAVLVRDKASGKEGIAFLFRKQSTPVIVGAGHALSNGGDNFSWLELWYVEDKGTLQTSYHAKAVKLKADAIVVAKEGSASALVYIRDGKAVWQQQGD